MEFFEFKGKNTEDAIKIACRELNLAEDELDIEVIEPGSTGIFGLVGGKKTKIRVSVKKKDIEKEEKVPEEEQAEPVEESPVSSDAAVIARETLENIISFMPLEDGVTVNVEEEGDTIFLKIEGDKAGLLIGRKGKTLDALQFLVNKIVNKALERRTNIVIDSEGYRERRKDFLIQTALKLGEKAKKVMKPVSTDLLNPKDRRIVHMTLRNDKKLDTRSRGEGHLKRVVIFPKKRSSK